MINVLVYKGHALVGKGWIIYHDGKEYQPTIVAIDGTELPEDLYNLVAIEQYLIVVNGSIH